MGTPRTGAGRRGAFADRLRKRRIAEGLTQAEVAAVLGVSRVTLARWESATHKPKGGPALRYVEGWIASNPKGGARG